MRHYDATEHEHGQRTAAGIVLEHPEQYGAGLVRWAEMHLARHGQQHTATVVTIGQARQREPEQMQMFERTEAA